MTLEVAHRPLDPTPPRPHEVLRAPGQTVRFDVTVSATFLANPLVAVQRLLASEADAFAKVLGDETQFEVQLALGPDDDHAHAEAWVRWATHCAGIRGTITPVP